MASPTPEVFAVYDNSGNPLTGVAAGMSFSYYGTEAGVAVLPQPAISEIGTSGIYKFTPGAIPSGHGLAYILVTGHQPAYVTRYVRPEDYAADTVIDLKNLLFGTWEIKTTGPDANKMVFTAPDGVTVVLKVALTDIAGLPTVLNAFKRTPA